MTISVLTITNVGLMWYSISSLYYIDVNVEIWQSTWKMPNYLDLNPCLFVCYVILAYVSTYNL